MMAYGRMAFSSSFFRHGSTRDLCPLTEATAIDLCYDGAPFSAVESNLDELYVDGLDNEPQDLLSHDFQDWPEVPLKPGTSYCRISFVDLMA